jgi:hypothetical protein
MEDDSSVPDEDVRRALVRRTACDVFDLMCGV